jgi:hypothetical protein
MNGAPCPWKFAVRLLVYTSRYRITGAVQFDVEMSRKGLFKLYLRRGIYFLRFEVFTSVTMKNAVFWEVASCGACYN